MQMLFIAHNPKIKVALHWVVSNPFNSYFGQYEASRQEILYLIIEQAFLASAEHGSVERFNSAKTAAVHVRKYLEVFVRYSASYSRVESPPV